MKHSGKKSEADKLQQKADHAIERYRELYDFAPSGYFTLSRGSEITEHNHTGAQMLGREHANLINNRFDIFVSEDTRPVFHHFLELAFKTKARESCEITILTISGSPAFIHLTGILTRKGDACLVTLVDITGRKNREEDLPQSEDCCNFIENKQSDSFLFESEDKYSKAFQTSPYAIIISRLSDGKVMDVNNSFCAITGFSREEALNDTSFNLNLWVNKDDRQKVVVPLMEGKEIIGEEFQFHKKSGEILTGLYSGQIIWIKQERYIFSSINDITDRKQTEKALVESETLYRAILNASPDYITITDMEGYVMMASPSGWKMFGYHSLEDIKGRSIIEFILPADREKALVDIGRMHQGNVGKPNEYRAIRLDGSVFDVEVNGEFIRNHDGVPASMVFIVRDITDRKKDAVTLKQSEENLSNAQEIAKMGSWEYNFITGKLTCSKHYYALLGLQTFDYEGDLYEYFYSLVHPDDKKIVHYLKQSAYFKDETKIADLRIVLPDGKVKWLQNNVVPVYNGESMTGLKGVNIDITEKKEADEKIKQQNERLSAIVGAMPDLIFVLDQEGTYTEVYSSDPESLIVPVNQIIGINIRQVFDKGTAAFHLENIEQCLRQNKLVTYEYTIVKEYLTSYYEARVMPLGMNKVLALVRDITNRKETEFKLRDLNTNLESRIEQRTVQLAESNANLQIEINERVKASNALQESLDRLNKIADRVPGLVYQYLMRSDGSSCFPFASQGVKDIFRVNPEDILDDAFILFSRIHPDDLGEVVASIHASAINLTLWLHEFRVKFDDGTERWIIGNAMPQAEDKGSVLWHGFISDITERKQVEKEIIEAKNAADKANKAKSEFLSRMSHELRTPMNSILGFAQLMNMGELNPKQQKNVNQILMSGRHLLNLIDEVLDISRIESGRLVLMPEPVHLISFISETMETVQPLANARQIKLELENSPANQLFIMADRKRLKQVLLNLLNNAVKYNREGGSIRIITEMPSSDDKGPFSVRISVEDTGYGIPSEEMSRLFKPFERIGVEKTHI